MDYVLTTDVLHQLIMVKVVFFVFVVLGLYGVYKQYRAWFFVMLIGSTSALAYYLLVNNMELMLWGLKADEITIAAMYEMFSQGAGWVDFAYADLPPFYPPLFFWFFGKLGAFFDMNGVQVAKLAAFVSLGGIPVLLFASLKQYWKHTTIALCSTIAVLLVIDWDAMILKPYELIGAAGVIIWGLFLTKTIQEKKMTDRLMLRFGISGGILFLLFYFWFFLFAIGLSLYHAITIKKTEWQMYKDYAMVALVIFLVGSVYWFPLAQAYQAFGSENWQLGFLTVEWIGTHGPLLDFSLRGLILFGGLASLIFYRKQKPVLLLITLFVAGYIWQLMGFTGILLFDSPMQESKGFYFWNRTILAIAAGYGVGQLWQYCTSRFQQAEWQKTVQYVGVLVLAPLMLFGTFTDDPVVIQSVQEHRHLDPHMKELVRFLHIEYPDIAQLTVLHSSLVKLHAFLPINDAVYFNQHNSHPAANFSRRKAQLEIASETNTVDDFYATIHSDILSNPTVFVFYKEADEGYPIFFHLDNYPNRFREDIVWLPKEYFVDSHVKQVFENQKYVVFEKL